MTTTKRERERERKDKKGGRRREKLTKIIVFVIADMG
jgi:hypothetical protein